MATHCHVERYVCPANNPEEVADAVELAMNTIKGHQHISTHKSGDVCEVSGIYTTKKCGWIDSVYFHCAPDTTAARGTVVKAYGESTNILPGWFPDWMRTLTAAIPFDDHKQNKRHIREIMSHLGLEHELSAALRGGVLEDLDDIAR